MAELGSGFSLAGYRIEALLGSGSMGSVYSALDVELERRVAIKVLLPELARDERFRERFLRESRLAAGLEHPNVVPVTAPARATALLYIAMRYVDGRDLAATLQIARPARSRAGAATSSARSPSALDAAHARGLVHRDVKPANILIAGDRHVYLCDFGLAKHVSTVSSLSGERGDRRHRRLPRAGADRGHAGRRPRRRLRARLRALRVPDRLAAVRARQRAGVADGARQRGPAVDHRPPSGAAGGDGRRAGDGARPRPRGPLRDVLGDGRRRPHGTRGRRRRGPRAARAGPRRCARSCSPTSAATRATPASTATRPARRWRAASPRSPPRPAPAYKGHLQELRGDEALLVFDSARKALRFAIEFQRRIAAAALPRGVGIGLDAGEAVPVDDGFRGGALNRAARLCSLARAGEVLASEAVIDAGGRDRGHRLRPAADRAAEGLRPPGARRRGASGRPGAGGDRGRRLRRALVGTRARACGWRRGRRPHRRRRGRGRSPCGGERLPACSCARRRSACSTRGRWSRSAASTAWARPTACGPTRTATSGRSTSPARLMSRLDPRTRKVTGRVPLGDMEPAAPRGRRRLAVGRRRRGRRGGRASTPATGRMSARIELPAATPDPSDQRASRSAPARCGSPTASGRSGSSASTRRRNRVAATIPIGRRGRPGAARLRRGRAVGRLPGHGPHLEGRPRRPTPWSPGQAARRLGGGRRVRGRQPVAAGAGRRRGLAGRRQRERRAQHPDRREAVRVGPGDGEIFVANQNSGTITRIDTRTGRTRSGRIGHMPNSAAAAGGLRLGVAVAERGRRAPRPGPGEDRPDGHPGRPVVRHRPGDRGAAGAVQLHRAIGARLLRDPDGPQPRTGRSCCRRSPTCRACATAGAPTRSGSGPATASRRRRAPP